MRSLLTILARTRPAVLEHRDRVGQSTIPHDWQVRDCPATVGRYQHPFSSRIDRQMTWAASMETGAVQRFESSRRNRKRGRLPARLFENCIERFSVRVNGQIARAWRFHSQLRRGQCSRFGVQDRPIDPFASSRCCVCTDIHRRSWSGDRCSNRYHDLPTEHVCLVLPHCLSLPVIPFQQ